MTRSCSASSICSSRSDSSWAMRVTGMPVHIATISAMSSSSTIGRLGLALALPVAAQLSRSARAAFASRVAQLAAAS